MVIAMLTEGWVKLHREIITKPIWKLSSPEQKTILITLLLMANHQDNEWEFEGQKFVCKAGQFVTSINSISEACGKGISTQNVRTALSRFEKLGFLTNKSTKTGRLITIENWGTYQGFDSDTNKEANREITKGSQRPNKGLTTNGECKKDKNDKNKRKDIYGEFANVLLSTEELQKLKDKYPNDYLQRIDNLSAYIESKGAKYKSHYATILNWARKEHGNELTRTNIHAGAKKESTTERDYSDGAGMQFI